MHIQYRIHCIVALSNDRVAQEKYQEATSLDDLGNMEDDSVRINPRHYCDDWDHFRICLKTASARDFFNLSDKIHYKKMRRG